jgi:hypothetical protein
VLAGQAAAEIAVAARSADDNAHARLLLPSCCWYASTRASIFPSTNTPLLLKNLWSHLFLSDKAHSYILLLTAAAAVPVLEATPISTPTTTPAAATFK